jgi:hypothetical protein
MKRILAVLAVAASLAATALAAQAAPEAAAGFRIGRVQFDVVGRTKPYYARQAAEIEEGRLFPDLPSLEAYLKGREQLLLNERTLAKVSIEPVFRAVGPDGVVRVDLVVHIEDSGNVIALPYFKYDSNDGLLLSMRMRDYNFLGTMEPLKIDFNYAVDTGGVQDWEVAAQFDLPFVMSGYDFDWSFDQSIVYHGDCGLFTDESSMGLNVILPLWGGKLTFGPSQGVSINPEDDDYPDDVYRGWFFKSSVDGSYKIPLPVDLGYFGPLYGKLSASFYDYWNPSEAVPSDWSGPDLSFSEGLSFGRIDWLGNFRQGLEGSASLSEKYDFDSRDWTDKFSGYVDGHYKFGPRLGASGRVKAFYCFNDTDDSAGSEVRGILDDRIDTNAAIYLNAELPFQVYYYMPHEWTGVQWLSYIALEQHWAPFFDMALTHDKESGRWFNPKDGWYAAGLEVITFPYKVRSFYIRISAGFDIPTLLKTKSLSGRSSRDDEKGHEFSIGLGHFF